MARDIVRAPNAPPPPPTYSHAVRAAGLVFVSGTGPHDPVTGKIEVEMRELAEDEVKASHKAPIRVP